MPISIPFLLLCAILVMSIWHDHRERRIPNILVASGLTLAILLGAYLGGWAGLGHALAGLAVGLIVMLPFYALRFLGAGDVKLIAMVGAFVGPLQVGTAILYTMLVGGLLAIVALVYQRYNKIDAKSHTVVDDLTKTDSVVKRALASRSKIRLPYAWAVTFGTVLSQISPLR